MAKVYENNKKFLIIQMNAQEATELNFGIQVPGINNICLCGTCNNECVGDRYYIAGINELVCEDCIEDFVRNMNHYTDEDSLFYEVNHFNFVANKLGMDKTAVIENEKIVLK